MAEEKRRFLCKLVVRAVVGAPLFLGVACAPDSPSPAVTGRESNLYVQHGPIQAHMPEADVLKILDPPQSTTESNIVDRTLLAPGDSDGGTSPGPPLQQYFSELEHYPLPRRTPPLAVTKKLVWQEGASELTIVMMRRFLPRQYVTMRNGAIFVLNRGPNAPYWSDDWVVAQKEFRAGAKPSTFRASHTHR